MARQNLPPAGSFAVAAAPRRGEPKIIYITKSNNYTIIPAWHGTRIVNAGSAVMGVACASSQNLSGEQRMPSVYSASVFQMACAALAAVLLSVVPVGATSRIKDLANIEGVRQNQLI